MYTYYRIKYDSFVCFHLWLWNLKIKVEWKIFDFQIIKFHLVKYKWIIKHFQNKNKVLQFELLQYLNMKWSLEILWK